MYNHRLLSLCASLVLAAFLVAEPGTALQAASAALHMCLTTVIPALFPFFVLAELLTGFGLARLLGLVLEPVMRPIFRLPGAAGFGVAVGYISGFPVGASVALRLFEEGLLTAPEAARLTAFSNNPSPLFIIGVVGAGFFHSAAAGYLLVVSLYTANLLVGIIIGHLPSPSSSESLSSMQVQSQDNKEGNPIARAVRNAVFSAAAVTGYVVFFSVVTEAARAIGLLGLLSFLCETIGISPSGGLGLATGFFEMTLGMRVLSVGETGLLEQLMAASALLSWSGLCVQMQVIGITVPIPVKWTFYVKSRMLQTLLSLPITYVGYHFITGDWNRFSDLLSLSIIGLMIGLILAAILLKSLKGLIRAALHW